MAVNLSPVAGAAAQFLDNSGNVLTGGKLYTYAAGTTTPQATYTSSAGVTFHSNPIILDAAGRVPAGGEIWLSDNVQYKFVLKDSNDVLIGTWDNLIGINSNFLNFYTQEEIQTATAGQTVFTLTTVSYTPGTNSLSVFVDGVNQYDGAIYAYVETDSTTVTFTAGLHVGALVKFTTAVTLSAGVTSANLVTFTGFKGTNRPQFQLMMSNLRSGDIVNVHSLDRVGRNTKDILEIVQEIKDKGCLIHFHKENLKFDGTKSDLYSDLMLTILAGFSQFERNIILERQREGIAIAKVKGMYKGRRSKLTAPQLENMKIDFKAGLAKTEIAKKYDVTRAYVYQLVNQTSES